MHGKVLVKTLAEPFMQKIYWSLSLCRYLCDVFIYQVCVDIYALCAGCELGRGSALSHLAGWAHL